MSGQKNHTTRNLMIRQFKELLSSNEQLNELYTHAKDIHALNEKLEKYLTPSLGNHCSVASYSEDTLTINAETSAWASKLRYRIPDILSHAKRECRLNKLKSIRIKVYPGHESTKSRSSLSTTSNVKKPFLSKKSAAFIKNIALSIEDPALRESIIKISEHAE